MNRSRAAIGLLAGCLSAAAAPAEVVERILAVVDSRPLMLSEVRLVEQLRGLGRPAALEALVDEQLMLREASRLAQSVVTAEDEQRAYESLLARNPGAAGLPEADLRRLVRRQTAILKYVEFRFRPQVQIGDGAVRQVYEREYGSRAEPPSFDAVAPEIRRQLADRELDAKIEAWVKELREGAEIRYNP
ncbi:MAG: hypothetical protein DMF81_16460 [Acidobacteria bacterium]|nr:MAG: hypothetical protein DMF81_16460 [Acidobacteriota bacterium]